MFNPQRETKEYTALQIISLHLEKYLNLPKKEGSNELEVRFGTRNIHRITKIDLEQVMTLKSKFISIKKVFKGDRVGYEGTWKAKKENMIGILPIGYADGYLTGMGNSAYVLVDGIKAKVIGRVSMDLTAVDLSKCVNVDYNSEVILWGSNLKLDKVSKFANSIPYELITSVSRRVKREYVYK